MSWEALEDTSPDALHATSDALDPTRDALDHMTSDALDDATSGAACYPSPAPDP